MDTATTNGNLTPPTAQQDHCDAPSGTKRKRSLSSARPTPAPAPATATTTITADQQKSLSAHADDDSHEDGAYYLDILDVFRKYDTTPSILDHALHQHSSPPPDAQDAQDAPDAPSAKRVKLADGESPSTISSKLQDGAYTSLRQLQQDIVHVCTSIIDSIKSKERTRNGARLPADDIKTMQRVLAFQHLTTAALKREGMDEDEDEAGANGEAETDMVVKKEPVHDSKPLENQQARTVLTLFGNAPTPRQLFTSFQHPAASVLDPKADPKADGADLELEELGLPNMLNATKVLPLDPDVALGARQKEPTFADVFPPPANLPPLNPPKPRTTARSASISWITGDSQLPKPSRKNAYTMQPLNVGSWLEYGGRDADRESSSAIKRRRRESVVSTAPAPKAIEDMSPAEIMAQEQALFKAAYSSFAPTVDNSKAIVPEEVRDRVWWHRLGHKRFDKHFVLDPALDNSFPSPLPNGDQPPAEEPATLGSSDELKELEAAVENFDEDAFNADSLVSNISDEDRGVEQILQDISGLIETLSSFQRIRNSYVATAQSRNPTSPSPALASIMGTPTEPTKEEVSIYKALRSQLAQMIAKLPPYAVAKLDGEQLEDLAVDKTIIVEGKEFKGTMEEDQLTRMIRSSAAMQAAAGPASAVRPSAELKNYGRTPSTAQPARSSHAPNPSYYSSARTPATNYNRSTVAQSYSTPTATGARPSYGQAPSYAPNTAGRQSSYSHTNGQSSYRAGFNYNNTFSAQPTPQQPVQTPGGYNTQPNQFRNTTAYNQNAAVSTPSYNSQQAGQQPRPNYGAATAPQFMQQRPNSQPQQPKVQQPNSGRATPTMGTNPQTPSALGPSGFHTSMTSEQQQVMMERQRAQLAQQPLARAQAQPDTQRVPSATPQPPPPSSSAQPQQGNQPQTGDEGRGASGTPVAV